MTTNKKAVKLRSKLNQMVSSSYQVQSSSSTTRQSRSTDEKATMRPEAEAETSLSRIAAVSLKVNTPATKYRGNP